MWVISEINNSTHTVTLSHSDGRKDVIVIPKNCRDSSSSKNAFLKSHTDALDTPPASVNAEVGSAPAAKQRSNKRAYMMISVIITVALWYLIKFKAL